MKGFRHTASEDLAVGGDSPNDRDSKGDSSHSDHVEDPEKHPVHDMIDVHNTRAFKGDDSDGKVEWSFRSIVAVVSLGILYSGSQCLLYFTGGSLRFIQQDLNIGHNASWLPVSYTLAMTAAGPFAGYMQDLLGRRNITIFGAGMVVVGAILLGTSQTFGQGVVGLALAGGAAVMSELASLAGISDVVPVRQRGIALAVVVTSLLPFTPYILYCQLLGTYSSWRWGPWITIIWNGIGLTGVTLTYFPKEHTRLEGFKKRQLLSQLDFPGIFMSITGITLLLVALESGGNTKPWKSAYVLCQLIIGAILLLSWMIWESKFAKFPMVPKVIFQGQRVVSLVFLVAFVAGFNFFSLINFYPLALSLVYGGGPVAVGLRGLGYGMGVTIGAIIFNSLISTRIEAKYVLLIPSIMMTSFIAGLAGLTPHNPAVTIAMGTFAALGTGGIIVPSATVAMIVVPDSVLTTTAALTIAIRSIGGSIGFTIYYNIFARKLESALPKYVAEYAIGAGLSPADAAGFVSTFLTNPQEIASAPGFTAEISQAAALGVRWAYAYALKFVWYTSIPFGLLAIIGCLFIPSIKQYQTARIAVKL